MQHYYRLLSEWQERVGRYVPTYITLHVCLIKPGMNSKVASPSYLKPRSHTCINTQACMHMLHILPFTFPTLCSCLHYHSQSPFTHFSCHLSFSLNSSLLL